MREEYLIIFHCDVLILTQMKYDNFTGLTCVLNMPQNADKTKAELFYLNLDKHNSFQYYAIYMLLSCNEI